MPSVQQIPIANLQKSCRGTHAVLFLLDLLRRPVLEHPANNIGIWTNAFDLFAALEGAPEGVKGGELDEMPDLADMGWYEGAFDDGGGCGNQWLRHLDWLFTVASCEEQEGGKSRNQNVRKRREKR